MPAAKGLTFRQLDTAFRRRNFKPIYFLYGDETFLMDELQRTLVEHALEPHERDFNYDLVYGPETDAGALLGICRSYPLMAERRVVVVRNFEALKKSEPFAAYAGRPMPSTVLLLLCARKPDLRRKPFGALKSMTAWAEIKQLRERDMPGWIDRRVKRMGRTIEPQAAARLADFVGTSLRPAANEIDKLITYAGERDPLTVDDVVRAGGQTREINIFELQRAVGDGRQNEALRIGDRLLGAASSRRGEALRMIAVLGSYFTKLWKLHGCRQRRMPEREMAKATGISPFFLHQYLHSLSRFGPEALKAAFSALLAADHELKGGTRRSERLVVTLLLRKLTA